MQRIPWHRGVAVAVEDVEGEVEEEVEVEVEDGDDVPTTFSNTYRSYRGRCGPAQRAAVRNQHAW